MDALISLSVDFQIVLIAGFLAFKITAVGRGLITSTEDFLLQVLLFGSIARGVVFLVEFAAMSIKHPAVPAFSGDAHALAVGLLTLVAGVVAGAVWRKVGNRLTSSVMRATGTHNDDHESSTWASIMATRATWTYVQLHLADGRVLESWFDRVPSNVPGGSLVMNDDGVSIYITRIYRPDATI
ncbi:MAG: hypothetical protein EON59_12070, partial [Alphaproteobacteria bacterium]